MLAWSKFLKSLRFGVLIATGAQNNVIGGENAGEGNLISGNFESGVQIENSGTNNNQVLGNLIGTDATGGAKLANDFGVIILDGAQNNLVGGESDGARNIISGNHLAGLQIQGAEANNNRVEGNYIGTDITGIARLGNKYGVIITDDRKDEGGPNNNVIGGSTKARNLISGNDSRGIEILGRGTANNRVEGNYIGTNITGTQPLGNHEAGILIGLGTQHNTIGGPNRGNLISGNDGVGIQIQSTSAMTTTDNLIQSNYIGTDATGMVALPNVEGINILDNAHRNIIGGTTPNERNIISGNNKNGVWIGRARQSSSRQLGDSGISENQVLGNYIGTDVTGEAMLGNQWGVVLNESQNNMIGCHSQEGCNIISGNKKGGIAIQQASHNQVFGNFIGTDVSGTTALPNGSTINDEVTGVGIGIMEGAHHNVIGGAGLARNIISGNAQAGIDIRDEGTTHNEIVGNYIGTDKTGTQPLSNRWGVAILADADHNIIGGDSEEKRNLISGNTEAGVQIQGVVINDGVFGSADHNRVQGNYIGTDVTGSQALGNRWGIGILGGAENNMIGGAGLAGNIISGNFESGIEILNYQLIYESRENQVQGNYIGVGANGTPLGNGFAGICLFDGSHSNTIGPNNTIAHNADAGVRLQPFLFIFLPLANTITQNSIHDNVGLPIDFIDLADPINPSISNWTDNVVEGTACSECRIEIFANPDPTPAGTLFLAAGTADNQGNFTITLPSPVPAEYSCLSMTVTDQEGTTSEFSDSLCSGDPLPTITPTATASATPTVTSATPTATTSATPTATATPTVAPPNTKHTLHLPLVIR